MQGSQRTDVGVRGTDGRSEKKDYARIHVTSMYVQLLVRKQVMEMMARVGVARRRMETLTGADGELMI